MSKSTSIFLTLLTTLAWFWFCHWWYTCQLMHACYGCGESAAVTQPVQEAQRYPLDFQWSDATAHTNPGFDEFKQRILAGMTDNNTLEIVGLYYEGEPAPEGFENMGLARAAKIKALFSPPVPDNRVILRARLVPAPEGVRSGYFESAEFNWMEGERKTVEELADRIIIRFPFNSTEKDYDASVDDYLVKLTKRIKETGESVSLTGHTDNVGDDTANLKLGERRAKAIRDILVKKGAKREQINTDSKGETQPVASNDTEEGRHDNRRVELRLLRNK
jgi:outer membrane protein OmpA-like peptidoglycan-associated protein